MDTLIRGGTVVLPSGAVNADILVRGEKIEEVFPDGGGRGAGGDARGVPGGTGARTARKGGATRPLDGARVIDATGGIVVPGGVDVHTHFDLLAGTERASDDWRTGTIAAACGGTTTVVDHPAFGPKGCALFHQINAYHALAAGAAAVDYSFHGVVQRVDVGVLDDLEALARSGIPSVKIYLTYDFRLEDADVLRVMKRMRVIGGVTCAHCEDHAAVSGLRERFRAEGKGEPWFHALSRPPEAEASAVGRMARLSEAAGGALLYVVHLSSAAGLEEVRKARARGLPVFAETCPQYLLLTEERYHEPGLGGLKYVMSPPLRTAADTNALWEGLADGSIQTAATDHCPFTFARKKELGSRSFADCPNGAPGVETRIPLLFSEGVSAGRLTLKRFVEVTAEEPAKLMGMFPRKGALLPGSDADIAIIDPSKRVTLSAAALHSRVDYTPFEGMEVRGYPVMVMLRGKLIARDARHVGSAGDGVFLKRCPPVMDLP
jgi:dihydropyrimidinase